MDAESVAEVIVGGSEDCGNSSSNEENRGYVSEEEDGTTLPMNAIVRKTERVLPMTQKLTMMMPCQAVSQRRGSEHLNHGKKIKGNV